MRLRLVIPRALLIVMGCCFAQEMGINTQGEEQFMLSGDWKFHAIYGEGSNYRYIYLPTKRILGMRS